MPTMLCRSCGKIIPLAPVECPQCGARQDRAAVPAKTRIGPAHVAGALIFGLISGLAGGLYMNRPTVEQVMPGNPPGVYKVTPEPRPEPAPQPRPAPLSGAVNYQIAFLKGGPQLTPDGEVILERIAETMHYYPLDSLNVVGCAGAAENDAQSLATARAFLVKAMLSDRHGIKKERIQTQTRVVSGEAHKVEVYIVAGHLGAAQSVGSAQ